MACLRFAKSKDIFDIAEIHTTVWREVYHFIPEEVHASRTFDHRVQQWRRIVANPVKGQALLVVEEHGKIGGFCFACPSLDKDTPKGAGEMHAAYILPDFRGGITGTLMMISMSVVLDQAGLSPMTLWAFQENRIHEWYAALGWKPFIKRDRVIEGVKIPEIGFFCNDPKTLQGRLLKRLTDANYGVCELPREIQSHFL